MGFNPTDEELRDLLAKCSASKRKDIFAEAALLFNEMCRDETVTTPTPHAALVEATWRKLHG